MKQIKPEIIERLKALNHEKVGKMADALGIEPQTLRNHHFKKNTKTLCRLESLNQIKEALDIEMVEDAVEEVENNFPL